ncbi:MAG: hypothetical protein ACE5HA_15305, partial [Anaerolineae bacterium]
MSMALAGSIRYEPPIEQAIQEIEDRLRAQYQLSRRAVALLLLQDDAEFSALVRQQESPADVAAIQDVIVTAFTECCRGEADRIEDTLADGPALRPASPL